MMCNKGEVVQGNQLLEQSVELAAQIIELCRTIKPDVINSPIISQVVRSSSSVMANISEGSVSIFSQKERAYRFSVSLREIEETLSWLLLMKRCLLIKQDAFAKLSEQCLSIKKMLFSSLKTLKANKTS